MTRRYSTIIVILSFTSIMMAQSLDTLETYYPNDQYWFQDWYPQFNMTISETGDILGLYDLMSYGEESYIMRHYTQNEPAKLYYIGGYTGNGGCYFPYICGFENQNLLIQISCYGDLVEPYDTHKLMSIDLTNSNNHNNQYFYSKQSQIKGIWKTDSSHASAFSKEWRLDGDDALLFIKEIDLFDEWQDLYDSNFVVNGDTLMEIPSVSSFHQQKLISNNTFLSIYDLTGSDNWSSVCVTLDSVVTQIDSIFPRSTTIPHLDATEEKFMTLFKMPDEESVHLWTYNPLSQEISNDLIYTSPVESGEYLGGYQSTILTNEIVLQIPVLRSGTSTAVSNWYGLINKRISRGDYSILATDTIFVFETQTDIIRHQIDNDGSNTHSLIGIRTPEYSRIYYYGINNLVMVEKEQNFVPRDIAIRNTYPNPFNNQLRIAISLPEHRTSAILQIFDLKGRLVWSKKDLQGTSIIWNGQDLNGQDLDSGVYLLKLSSGSIHDSQKILMIK